MKPLVCNEPIELHTQVTDHLCPGVSEDANSKIRITCVACHTAVTNEPRVKYYDVEVLDDKNEVVGLQRLMPYNGTTHEVLLAIVKHRLELMQTGNNPCQENAEAIKAITGALAHLHDRTTRLHKEKFLAEKLKETSDVTARVHRTPEGGLQIGDTLFTKEQLSKWGEWDQVISAAKKLDPALTSSEIATIEASADGLGGGAHNGRIMFRSVFNTVTAVLRG